MRFDLITTANAAEIEKGDSTVRITRQQQPAFGIEFEQVVSAVRLIVGYHTSCPIRESNPLHFTRVT